MKKTIPSRRLLPLAAAASAAALLLPVAPSARAQDADGLPPNLGRGLHPLVAWHQRHAPGRTAEERRKALVAHVKGNRRVVPGQVDAAGNVIVDIRLTGTVAAADVKKNLAALGLTIIAEHEARHADRRDGVLSARLPLDQAAAAARVDGVQSVLLARRPRQRAGQVPGQGLPILHADQVQAAGFTGAGITVGVISDSYDQVSPHAAADVLSGDLPQGVVVLNEDTDPADADYVTDEGRAMLQIVHDVAPGAKLAFSTTGSTESAFANAIEQLRTDPRSLCDVLVDDIGFSDEPFFSDSLISEAVDAVVTSTALAGKRVIYYSAAGNDGSASYDATFDLVTDGNARAGNAGFNNLKLDQVPASLTTGGFHNFKGADKGHGVQIVQKVTVSGADAEIDFQWDDPFNAGKMTSDYNILVFDADGNYLPGDPNSDQDIPISGIDNNFSTGEALEYAELPLNSDGSDAVYQLVITRAATRGANPAARLRYFAYTNDTFYGKYIHTGKPTLFGHSAAANADGVAAYDVHNALDAEFPEPYDSSGPVTILFDANGNRLATPIVRNQPTIAAVDGVNTTFFPQPASDNDLDGDGLPNFYGTSAAAPHAAGVAALLLQAGGGPGSVTAAHMRSLLESTAGSHDLDPAFASATLTSPDGSVRLVLSANGDDSNNSAFDLDFFNVTFTAPAGASLTKLTIDVGLSGEVFDPSTDLGFPFKLGDSKGVNTALVAESLLTDASGIALTQLQLIIGQGAFESGGSLSFGLDRDDASTNAGGNSADFLTGTKVKAKFKLADGSKVKLTGTVTNRVGTGYSPDVGYGLINAEAALQALQAGK